MSKVVKMGNCRNPAPVDDMIQSDLEKRYSINERSVKDSTRLRRGKAGGGSARGSGALLRGSLVYVTLFPIACTAPRGPLVVTNPDPSVKIPAMERAVREKDSTALPQLVKDLDSDDAAVRMYANHALEQLTGEHFGFKYFAGEDEREAAAQKWREWLSRQNASRGKSPSAATRAASGPS